MTFQEAIEFKRKLGNDQVTQDELTMKVIVTPAAHDEFTRFVTDYWGGHFSGETSKKFSLNGQFKVNGLWTYGADFLYKDLIK